MIALKGYARLEGPGIWRASDDAQRRDVVVSFGEASLIISDKAGRPLAHWSLPAIKRLNPGKRPALYSPDEHQEESLELAEETLIDALETIGRALGRVKPKPGRLRGAVAATGLAAIAALGFFWLPGVMVNQAEGALRPASLRDLDGQILRQITPFTGPVCRRPDGLRAANMLRARLSISQPLLIVPGPLPDPVTLPGGTILLDIEMIEGADDPAVAAGYALAAAHRQDTAFRDSLRPQGLRASFRLLTNGKLNEADAKSIARRLASRPAPSANPEALKADFAERDIDIAPWAEARYGMDGPYTAQGGHLQTSAVITDAQWVSLQNICSAGEH